MGNLFSGSKKKDKITARDKAILELKVQRDRLKQYQKKVITILNVTKIEVVITRETEAAKQQLAAGNKDRALLALRRKKYQQSTLEKTFAQLLNLEQLTSGIEFALVEQQVLAGLKTGNTILKELQSEVRIEEVEELMADTAEAIAYQNEISAMLSGKITSEEEEDVLAELEELQGEVMGEVLPEVPAQPSKRQEVFDQPESTKDLQEEEAGAEEEEPSRKSNSPMLA